MVTHAIAAYPDKPIKMMVGYAPGSSTDIVGRIIANELGMALKQSVIVENRGGAAGSLAADAVAKSTPDGYTVLFAQNGLAINVAANPKLPDRPSLWFVRCGDCPLCKAIRTHRSRLV